MPIHLPLILRAVSQLVYFYASILAVPIIVALIYEEEHVRFFVYSLAVCFIFGAGLALFSYWIRDDERVDSEMNDRDAILTTIVIWFALTLVSSVPFKLTLGISWSDAIFEAASGITTTGSTILVGLDHLDKSLLIFRQLLQWIGGMGLVVLAVAILPYLGGGASQIYRIELPGFSRDVRLTPRVERTAGWLWGIYVGLTLLCAWFYWHAGMSGFDAVAHALSTVSIGGFSTYDANMGHFTQDAVKYVAMAFMIISAANYGLHFVAVTRMSTSQYWRNTEFRVFLLILAGLMTGVLVLSSEVMRTPLDGAFMAVSFFTTTGFTSHGFNYLPSAAVILLIIAACVGPCGGSVGGGIKMVRLLLVFKQAFNHLYTIIHPHAVQHIKLGDKVQDSSVLNAVWSFLVLYVLVMLCSIFYLTLLGIDGVTASSAVIACLNNLGPGLGEVQYTFASLPDSAKWVLVLNMIMGRLELLTFLVVFTRAFWRR